MTPPRRVMALAAAAGTIAIEGITIVCRALSGSSAADFIARHDPPLLLRIHHFFWAFPVFGIGLLVKRPRARAVILGLAVALMASDLIHHLVVLPLWKGNFGWHWP